MTVDAVLRRGALLLAALCVTSVALAPVASGSETERGVDAHAAKLQRKIDSVLRHAAPGGRQIAPNKIEWARDGVVLTLPARASARRGLGDCRRGWACVWQHANYQGGRGEFYRYGYYDLAAYGLPPYTLLGASSYYNNQTGGARAHLHGNGLGFPFNMIGHRGYLGGLNDKATRIQLLR